MIDIRLEGRAKECMEGKKIEERKQELIEKRMDS